MLLAGRSAQRHKLAPNLAIRRAGQTGKMMGKEVKTGK